LRRWLSGCLFYGGAAVMFLAILIVGILPPDRTREARQAVAAALARDGIAKIEPSDLSGRRNWAGAGVYVYVDRAGPAPRALWLVLHGRAYSLNGTARGQTPGLAYIGDAMSAEEQRRLGIAATEELLARFYGR
jgi:hypothetical protein